MALRSPHTPALCFRHSTPSSRPLPGSSTILQAFQTWAVNANINIGLVSDGGQPLGVAGDPQHDPRFGDIRIGAQPMDPGTLSISVPNDPLISSTLSGDVLINSQVNFNNGSNNLFTALLHEAGHVLGIGDSSDPNSPMNTPGSGNHPVDRRRYRRLSRHFMVPGHLTRTRGQAATIGSTRRPRSRPRAVPAATQAQLPSSRMATSRRTRTSISTPSKPRMTIRDRSRSSCVRRESACSTPI